LGGGLAGSRRRSNGNSGRHDNPAVGAGIAVRRFRIGAGGGCGFSVTVLRCKSGGSPGVSGQIAG